MAKLAKEGKGERENPKSVLELQERTEKYEQVLHFLIKKQIGLKLNARDSIPCMFCTECSEGPKVKGIFFFMN